MSAGNNTKMNISYVIRAVDRFTQTHKRLERQLDNLERKAEKVAQNKKLKVDANTKQAERKLDKVDRKARDIPKLIWIHVKTSGQDARKQLDKVADLTRDITEVTGKFAIGSVIALLPPMIESTAGALGALASNLTSAALGSAGFAAVAVPSIVKVVEANEELKKAQEAVAAASNEEERAEALKELANVQKQYNSEQLKSVEAIRQFGRFFEKFQAKFEPTILDAFNRSLGTLQALLMMLEPAIEGVSNAVINLIESFNENLLASDVQKFFEWVGNTAGPNLEILTKALGNFIAGFGNMMVAFDPLAQDFMNGFLDMSERFREWTAALEDNQAFQDFIAAVRENGPVVLDFVGKFVKALWLTIQAMAPFGVYLMELANKFLDWYNNNMLANESFRNFVGIAFTGIGAITALLAPVMMLGKFLTSLLGPAFLWVGTAITWVSDKLKGPLKNAVERSRGLFQRLGAYLLLFVNNPVKYLGMGLSWLGKRFLMLIPGIGPVISIVLMIGEVFGITMDDIKNVVSKVWDWMPDFITNAAEGIWNSVTGFFGKIKDVIVGDTVEAAEAVETNMDSMSTSFESKIVEMETTASTKFPEIESVATSNATDMAESVISNASKMESDFEKYLSDMDSEVYSSFGSMEGNVSDSMSDILGTTRSDWAKIESTFDSSLSSIDSDLSSSFDGMSFDVDSSMSDIAADIGTGWMNSESDTKSSLKAMTVAVAQEYQNIIKAVYISMDAVEEKVSSTMSEVVRIAKNTNLYSAGTNLINGMIRGVNSRRSALIRSVESAANAAVKAAKSTLGIHSPSRVFKQIAEYTGDGFIVGLNKKATPIARTTRKVMQGAIPNVVSPSYKGINPESTPENRSRRRTYEDDVVRNGSNMHSLTQNLHFYGEAANTPSATARKNRQALRDWAMEGRF